MRDVNTSSRSVEHSRWGPDAVVSLVGVALIGLITAVTQEDALRLVGTVMAVVCVVSCLVQLARIARLRQSGQIIPSWLQLENGQVLQHALASGAGLGLVGSAPLVAVVLWVILIPPIVVTIARRRRPQ